MTEKTFGLRSFTPPVPIELLLIGLAAVYRGRGPCGSLRCGVWRSVAGQCGAVLLDARCRLRAEPVADLCICDWSDANGAAKGLFWSSGSWPCVAVKLIRGDVQSVSVDQLLSGANLAVIGDGSAQNWEVFQFAQADIVDENTFDLSVRLRGQGFWQKGAVEGNNPLSEISAFFHFIQNKSPNQKAASLRKRLLNLCF